MGKSNILPYGYIDTPSALGKAIRTRRKQQGATQAEFASLCSVGVRFISDLENGKPTIELGKTLKALKCLGMEMGIYPRGWRRPDSDK